MVLQIPVEEPQFGLWPHTPGTLAQIISAGQSLLLAQAAGSGTTSQIAVGSCVSTTTHCRPGPQKIAAHGLVCWPHDGLS
jgi:hypothetical protein